MKRTILTNMKKLLFIVAILLLSSGADAEQVDMIIGSEGSKASLTTNFSRIQNNFTELFGRTQTDNNFTTPLKNKLDALPDGTNILTRTNTDTYTPSLDYHPATKKYVDDAPFAPALGADDNYVTDAEKTVIGNTSGANTGDQTAATVSVTDAGGYFTGTDAEAVLQEIGPLTDAVEITAGDNITIVSGVISAAGGGSITEATGTVYKDSPGSPGDMLWNDTTVYLHNSTGWMTLATLADNLGNTPGLPTVTSVTVGALGASADILFSEAITAGAGGSGGWAMLCDGQPITMTYSSGDTTSTLVYGLSPTPYAGDTCTVDYTQPGDGLENATGGDLLSFESGVVINNSEVAGAIASQTAIDTPASFATYPAQGQSFTVAENTASTITIKMHMATAGTTCELRTKANDWNMSITYLTTQNFTPAVGWNSVSVATGVLAPGLYMFEMVCDGGSLNRSASGAGLYAGGEYRLRTSATFNLPDTNARDMTFEVLTP